MIGDPREIVWQNLQVSSKRRYIIIFANNLCMLIILAISFYLVVQLTFAEEQYQAADDIILSITFSIIVEIINFALGMYIDFATQLEARYTLTGQTQIKIIKQTLVFFLNTTLIPFSLLIIESDRSKSNEDAIRNILTLILVCNIISPIISEYLQVAYLIKVYNRYRIKKAGICRIIQVRSVCRRRLRQIRFSKELILIYRIDMVFYSKDCPTVTFMPVSFRLEQLSQRWD